MSLLPAIEQETRENPDASVIWLHGLGANGYDFVPIVPDLQLPPELGIRFIFPHAPSIPVTVNNGYVMPAWFDIMEMQIDRKIDTKQLLESAAAINRFIDREIERGIDSRRIVLIGFSQGGAVAYQLALSNSRPLGGLIAMSSILGRIVMRAITMSMGIRDWGDVTGREQGVLDRLDGVVYAAPVFFHFVQFITIR